MQDTVVKMKGITVRLTEEEHDRLEEVCARYKVKQTEIIRWSIDALCDYADRHNGKIILPLDLEEIWQKSGQKKGSYLTSNYPPLSLVAEEASTYKTAKAKKKKPGKKK